LWKPRQTRKPSKSNTPPTCGLNTSYLLIGLRPHSP
jgi:hypothetical protein